MFLLILACLLGIARLETNVVLERPPALTIPKYSPNLLLMGTNRHLNGEILTALADKSEKKSRGKPNRQPPLSSMPTMDPFEDGQPVIQPTFPTPSPEEIEKRREALRGGNKNKA
eukprot:Gregarina_sp_Poly_1__648@NODE_1154_length_4924_cov_47_829319_g793_i0_p6_GENE_NODE_1154_length_4924_cov_47_829319_g793_i0NODE_1154_length_4924_cov_47_829319_g793_i0_p6_ORF_typecomplete_len115_score19_91Sex_peptide/PF08138_11/6_5Sex_peptide/PF08138_11/1_8e02_NODE_1154_length_4924_cov_47_829319_g793_i0547891